MEFIERTGGAFLKPGKGTGIPTWTSSYILRRPEGGRDFGDAADPGTACGIWVSLWACRKGQDERKPLIRKGLDDGGRSSAGRAPGCDPGRRGFESHRPPHLPGGRTVSGPLAQLVEQETLNLLVVGSTPTRPTIPSA